MPKLIGYARVSTEEQDPALQIGALSKAGCDPIFCDHGASGAKRDRPELAKALSLLNPGDKLVVWKLDRLARSVCHLSQLLEEFREEEIEFESLTEKIDTDTAYGEFVFHILAGVAQMERRLISERTKAGMQSAILSGAAVGRPCKISTQQAFLLAKLLQRGEHPRCLAKQQGVSEATVRRSVQRLKMLAA